jgi:hypothetical protein
VGYGREGAEERKGGDENTYDRDLSLHLPYTANSPPFSLLASSTPAILSIAFENLGLRIGAANAAGFSVATLAKGLER